MSLHCVYYCWIVLCHIFFVVNSAVPATLCSVCCTTSALTFHYSKFPSWSDFWLTFFNEILFCFMFSLCPFLNIVDSFGFCFHLFSSNAVPCVEQSAPSSHSCLIQVCFVVSLLVFSSPFLLLVFFSLCRIASLHSLCKTWRTRQKWSPNVTCRASSLVIALLSRAAMRDSAFPR